MMLSDLTSLESVMSLGDTPKHEKPLTLALSPGERVASGASRVRGLGSIFNRVEREFETLEVAR
jgi:hypothetical protein